MLSGFLAGFFGVILITLCIVVGWTVVNPAPASTPVPTLASVAGPTVVPPGDPDGAQVDTPPPAPGGTNAAASPALSELTPTPSRTGPIEYEVETGDTLIGIALAYGITVETLQAANDLDGERITPGQVLIIPPGPLPTPTPYVEQGFIIHTVSSGETLIGIGELYSVTVAAIQSANALESEIIQPGSRLRIPSTAIAPTIPISATADEGWRPSLIEGDLAQGYPLTLENDRFTMFYQPDTPADRAPDQVAALVQSALTHIEESLKVTLKAPFDVYIAGSLFAGDDIALRGRSFSSDLRNFYLYDGTGTPGDQRYNVTHELTHLVAWNTLGKPASVLLHEGLAVYTGVEAMEAADFMPLSEFCAAYYQADRLPQLSGDRAYLGHIRDLDLYFAAGCFVQYLIEEHGLADFKQLFATADYPGIYGRTLTQLEANWHTSLQSVVDELAFDPATLVAAVSEVTEAYDRLFTDFDGTQAQLAAYRALDRARITLLQGRFAEMEEHLRQFEALLKSQ